MTKVLSLRVSDELAARVDAEAVAKGLTRAKWCVKALEGQLADAKEPSGRVQAVRSQVPSLRPAREVQPSPKTSNGYWEMMSARQKRLNDKGRPPEKGAA